MKKRITLWPTTKILAEAVCDRVQQNLSMKEWKEAGLSQLPYERTCPNLPIHPTFLEEGKRLARNGDLDDAKVLFQRAILLDPYLGFDPIKEAEKLAAKASKGAVR
jgi:hypothetical protein